MSPFKIEKNIKATILSTLHYGDIMYAHFAAVITIMTVSYMKRGGSEDFKSPSYQSGQGKAGFSHYACHFSN